MKGGHNFDSMVSPGDRNRSVFELSESGASKALLDNVQFHLDGLFTLKSSGPRVECLYKLIEICTTSKQVLFAFRSNGIASTLLRLVGLLHSEKDDYVRFCLQTLAFILCQSENGDILEGFEIPRNVFTSLLSSMLQGLTSKDQDLLTDIEPEKNPNHLSLPSAGKLEHIRRKRKFAGKKGFQNFSADTIDENIPFPGQDRNQNTAEGAKMNNYAIGSTGIAPSTCSGYYSSTAPPASALVYDIVGKLQLLVPSIFRFFGYGGNFHDIREFDVVEMGRLLSLTVVSRSLITSAQYDTQTAGRNISNGSKSRSSSRNHGITGQNKDLSISYDDDKNNSKNENGNSYDINNENNYNRNNENENENDNDYHNGNLKQSIKMAVLSEYQQLLRVESTENLMQPSNSKQSDSSHTFHLASDDAERIGKNDANACCFLSRIVTEIALEIFTAIRTLEEALLFRKSVPDSQLKSDSDSEVEFLSFQKCQPPSALDRNCHINLIGKSRINRIFQVLGLLEAACFRCPQNQVIGSFP